MLAVVVVVVVVAAFAAVAVAFAAAEAGAGAAPLVISAVAVSPAVLEGATPGFGDGDFSWLGAASTSRANRNESGAAK